MAKPRDPDGEDPSFPSPKKSPQNDTGLSIRDYSIIEFIKGIISGGKYNVNNVAGIVSEAIELSDEFLKQRKL